VFPAGFLSVRKWTWTDCSQRARCAGRSHARRALTSSPARDALKARPIRTRLANVCHRRCPDWSCDSVGAPALRRRLRRSVSHRARSVSVEGLALGLLGVQRASHGVRCVTNRMQCSSGSFDALRCERALDDSRRVNCATDTPWNQKSCQKSHQVTFRCALVLNPTVIPVRCSGNRRWRSLS